MFPVVCARCSAEGPAFTGMRHFRSWCRRSQYLPASASMPLLSALCRRAARSRLAAAVRLASRSLECRALLVRLHPYEYMFYNPLVGGLEGAARRYEMDYWVNVMPEAVRCARAIISSCHRRHRRAPTRSASAARSSRSRITPTSGWRPARLAGGRFLHRADAHELRPAGRRPRDRTIERFGVPIGVVKDRRGLPREV